MPNDIARLLGIIGLLAVGIVLFIVYIFPVHCGASRMEGYLDYSLASVQTCPRGSQSYTDERGNTMCCAGEVTRNKCSKLPICTLSGNDTNEIPTCTEYKRRYLEKKSRQCPQQLPFYYESENGSIRGCGVRVNSVATEPSKGLEFCRLYGEKAVDEVQEDSCYSYEKRRLGKSIQSDLKNDFCVGLPFQTTQNAVPFQMGHCTKRPTTTFRQDSEKRFVNTMSEKCLDVYGAKGENGTPVYQWDCHNGNNQKWVLDEDKRLRPLHAPHMCLDVHEGNTQNGAHLVIWDCHQGKNQKWTIT